MTLVHGAVWIAIGWFGWLIITPKAMMLCPDKVLRIVKSRTNEKQRSYNFPSFTTPLKSLNCNWYDIYVYVTF